MDITPDGSSALISDKEEGHEGHPMWFAPILGGSAKRLGDGEGENFSPDGNSVIYSTYSGDIFTVRIDGTDKRKLASLGSSWVMLMRPHWSPDSRQIVFQTRDRFGHGSIHRVMATDESPRWLMSEETADMSSPDFSPNGSKVVFGKGGALDPTETIDLRGGSRNQCRVTLLLRLGAAQKKGVSCLILD